MKTIRYPFQPHDFALPPIELLGGFARVAYVIALSSSDNTGDLDDVDIIAAAKNLDVYSKDCPYVLPEKISDVSSYPVPHLAKLLRDYRIESTLNLGDDESISTFYAFVPGTEPSLPDYEVAQTDILMDFLEFAAEHASENIEVPIIPLIQCALVLSCGATYSEDMYVDDDAIVSILCAYYSSFDAVFQSIFYPGYQATYENQMVASWYDFSSFLGLFQIHHPSRRLSLNSIWMYFMGISPGNIMSGFLSLHPDRRKDISNSVYGMEGYPTRKLMLKQGEEATISPDFISDVQMMPYGAFPKPEFSISVEAGMCVLESINATHPAPATSADVADMIMEYIAQDLVNADSSSSGEKNHRNDDYIRESVQWSDFRRHFGFYAAFALNAFHDRTAVHSMHGQILVKSPKSQAALMDLFASLKTGNEHETLPLSVLMSFSLSRNSTAINKLLTGNLNIVPIGEYKREIENFCAEHGENDKNLFGSTDIEPIRAWIALSGITLYQNRGENLSVQVSPSDMLEPLLAKNTALARYCTHEDIEVKEILSNRTAKEDFPRIVIDENIRLSDGFPDIFEDISEMVVMPSMSNHIASILAIIFEIPSDRVPMEGISGKDLTDIAKVEYDRLLSGSSAGFCSSMVRIADGIAGISFVSPSKNEWLFCLLFAILIMGRLADDGETPDDLATRLWGEYADECYPGISWRYVRREMGEFNQKVDTQQKILLASAAVSLANSLLADEDVVESLGTHEERTTSTWSPIAHSQTPTLAAWADDLTVSALEGKLIEELIGRDGMSDKISTILSRKEKSSVILVGEPGCGKTSIVHELAQRIIAGDVPKRLQNKRIFSLDTSKLLEKTGIQGALEAKIQGIIEECIATEAILFIDEIHTIKDCGNRDINLASMIKPYLSIGELTIIGATTPSGYNTRIAQDTALARRFTVIKVPDLDFVDTTKALEKRKASMELYYGIACEWDIERVCALVASEYLPGRHSPDREIELLDTAFSYSSLRKLGSVSEDAIYEAVKLLTSNNIIKNRKEIFSAASSIIANKDNEDPEGVFEDIAGQKEAKTRLLRRLILAQSDIPAGDSPRNIFLFCGPSGVGKTFTALHIPAFLGLSQQDAKILSMNDYADRFTASRLLGAPPGYIGYDRGGELTSFVLEHPNGVVILDEIEKADPAVINTFLGVFDRGFIDAADGTCVDCRSITFVCTTNAGFEIRKTSLGFSASTVPSYANDIEEAKHALVKILGAPFVGRIDEVIMFSELSREDVIEACMIGIRKLQHDYQEKLGIQIDSILAENELAQIIAVHATDKMIAETGARGVWKSVENEIKGKVIEKIASV